MDKWIYLLLSFFIVTSVSAEDRKETTLITCTPFANADGTQVLETFARSVPECKSSATSFLLRVTDFKEGAVCSFRGEWCNRFSDLDSVQIAETDRLRQYLPQNAQRACVQTDGLTWRTEMISARNGFGCGVNRSAIRHYDFHLRRVSFMDGKGKIVGHLPLSEDRIVALLTK